MGFILKKHAIPWKPRYLIQLLMFLKMSKHKNNSWQGRNGVCSFKHMKCNRWSSMSLLAQGLQMCRGGTHVSTTLCAFSYSDVSKCNAKTKYKGHNSGLILESHIGINCKILLENSVLKWKNMYGHPRYSFLPVFFHLFTFHFWGKVGKANMLLYACCCNWPAQPDCHAASNQGSTQASEGKDRSNDRPKKGQQIWI